MNHGIWSMFQSYGLNNKIWMGRLRHLAVWWSSIVVALFILQAVVFTVRARQNYYTTDQALQEQYGEFWAERAEALNESFTDTFAKAVKAAPEGSDRNRVLAEFFTQPVCENFVKDAKAIAEAAGKQCPDVVIPSVETLAQAATEVEGSIEYAKSVMENQKNQ